MNCPKCGTQIPEGARACPFCRITLRLPGTSESAARRKVTLAAIVCGLTGGIGEFFAWILFVLRGTGSFRNAIMYLCLIVGVAGLICGIVGLVLSVRAKGRKSPKRIVFSAIGIAGGAISLFVFVMNYMVGLVFPHA